ncbi:restriction endonuclease subunit S [Ralstonia pseudosolanacearum]|uniref:restriction endonuclease subunit S n=1 Tax=Ralstonia pseudosolanacearum TaxID=1310165 RepID=UPI0026768C76|nr:restriction endonuclease subunit S [Ralstonia pseudosolanacearum]MDO3620594.1 restriction endonuclease subunit S [Ralstonia pseudosolanacearum]
MAKDNKSTATPRLRFPEFRKSKGWAKPTLSLVLCEHKLKSDGKSEVHSVSLTKGVIPQVEHMGRSFSSADTSHYSLAKPFDIIYTKSPLALFKLGIVKQHRGAQNAIVSPLYGVFSPSNRYVGQLIEAYFESPSRNTRYLDPLAQKGAKNTIQISNERFLSGKIYLPKDEREQQKIADCLTSLDEVITAQGRKVEALKAHKRGLMQQLFPREGETLPRLRFLEFRGGPEWETVKASELFANRTEKGDDDLPIYSVTMTDGLVKRSSLDRRIDDLADAEGNKKAYQHDIAYNIMRMWQGACGVASEECMVSPAYVVLSPQTGVHSDFYGYFFKLPQILQLFTSHSRGLTKDRLRLYYQDFGRIPLPRPDIREQRRIADCLHSLDAQIVTESAKLNALKTHKTSLMQQLFPSPEEI